MSTGPPKKRRRLGGSRKQVAETASSPSTSEQEVTSIDGQNINSLVAALVPALVPAVAQGVMATLQTMGVVTLPNSNLANREEQTPSNARNVGTSSQSSSQEIQSTSGINNINVNNTCNTAPPVVSEHVTNDMNPLNVHNTTNFSQIQNVCEANVSNPSINRPLGIGLDHKLKGKIWANEFVDFGQLLGTKKTGRKKIEITENTLGECSLKTSKQTQEVRNIEQWVQAFFIFVGIYTERNPQAAPALMKYGNMVQKLAKQVNDEAALYYDLNFREWRGSNPDLYPWDTLNPEIHSEALAIGLTKNKPSLNSSYGIYKKAQGQFPQNRNSFRDPPRFPCHLFNNRGFCSRDRCPYTHACQKCGGSHTKKQCDIDLPMSKQNQNTISGTSTNRPNTVLGKQTLTKTVTKPTGNK